MNTRAYVLVVFSFFLMVVSSISHGAGTILSQRIWTSGNGHNYAIVSLPQVSWEAASIDISSTLPGYHLATITSQAEQDFIWQLFLDTTGGVYDWWLGGYQDVEPETSPAVGWQWVTGEPWNYTNWAPGEPNDANGIEDHLALESWGQWNDCCTTEGAVVWGGYIAEYDSNGQPSGAPLTGSLHVFDPAGNDLCLTPDVCGEPVTGSYDAVAGTLSFDPIAFFGAPLVASSVELLPVGTHTRSDGFGGTITATVNPGQAGAYVAFSWSGNMLPTLMVWNVSGPASAQTFTPVDSDGDGIPGHAQTGGPFVGFSGIYEFSVSEPGPDIELSLNVTGGIDHECTGEDGAKVEITANVSLTGGAELDSVTWSVDGNSAGSGMMITPSLGLGTHTIRATALTTTGESDSQSVVVNVNDTIPPVLDIAFADSRTGESITQIDKSKVQWVEARFAATDSCDSSPVTNGVGGFSVQDGDLLKIQGARDTVIMTTSALSLAVTATDASGNTVTGAAHLQILH